ncbi:hypothetical protein DFJ73DRAFT_859767 [Zopfochytrium polystomum]|nr:hypothetical protein DFJ73DRAFT_859767 [Zopfochytrium polystomum]
MLPTAMPRPSASASASAAAVAAAAEAGATAETLAMVVPPWTVEARQHAPAGIDARVWVEGGCVNPSGRWMNVVVGHEVLVDVVIPGSAIRQVGVPVRVAGVGLRDVPALRAAVRLRRMEEQSAVRSASFASAAAAADVYLPLYHKRANNRATLKNLGSFRGADFASLTDAKLLVCCPLSRSSAPQYSASTSSVIELVRRRVVLLVGPLELLFNFQENIPDFYGCNVLQSLSSLPFSRNQTAGPQS